MGKKIYNKLVGVPTKDQEVVGGNIMLEGKIFSITDPDICTCSITGFKFNKQYTKYSLQQYISDIIAITSLKTKNNFSLDNSDSFTRYKKVMTVGLKHILNSCQPINIHLYNLGHCQIYTTSEKLAELITRLNLVKGENNPGVYYYKEELEIMDKPMPYRKFDNTFNKINFKDVIEEKLLITQLNSSGVLEIKKNILKRNIEMGVESISFKEFERLKYTYGIELESSQGRFEEDEVAHLNVKAVHDGSLREADGSNPLGGEYVTGILVGDSGLNQLHEICRVLQTKCKVDKRCGVHVHIGGLNWGKEEVVYSWILAELLEAEIFDTLPASRRDNSYCRPIKKLIGKIGLTNLVQAKSIQEYNIEIDTIYKYLFTEVSGLHPSEQPSRGINKNTDHPKGPKCGFDKKSQRYCWLNYVTLLFNTKKVNNSWTLEFRNMSGTLNYTKIKNWLKLCMAFCSFVENHKSLIKNSLKTPLTLKTVITTIYPNTGGKLNSYMDERKQLFRTSDETVDYVVDKKIARKTIKEVACAY